MSKVVVGLSVSLDGFVAGPNDGPDNPLGDGGGQLFAWWTAGTERLGPDVRFRPPARSREVVREAGTISIQSASVAQQYLRARLLDEVHMHLVPVLLGGGVRLFAEDDQHALERTRVVESDGVTHLSYDVIR
jgi:riboflavin biosynthesis pyrimidine reductase